jgi:hypothetical protein
MPISFWIKRFLVMFTGVFVILLAVALLRDRAMARAVSESALWAGIATAVFIASRIYHLRRGRHCELCGDSPDTPPRAVCEPRK